MGKSREGRKGNIKRLFAMPPYVPPYDSGAAYARMDKIGRPHSLEAIKTGLYIYGCDNKVAQHPSEMKATAAKQASFLRAVKVVVPADIPAETELRTFLDAANGQLGKVARYCGAQVVGHEYALLDNRSNDVQPRHAPPYLVPEGYMLVARVDTVQEAQPFTPEQEEQIRSGVVQYWDEANGSNVLKDIFPKQFMFGKIAGQAEVELRLVDTDIIYS